MDAIVIGLGAMGSAAAQHLAERGCRVRGFDQFSPPHNLGSSHGLTRIFRQAYFEDRRYVPLLMRSFELWKKLERDSGVALLHLPGALVLGPRDGVLVTRSLESAIEFDLPHSMLSARELQARYPVFHIESNTCALLERDAGYLVPEACIEQQIRQAVRSGAHIHTNEMVTGWHAGQHGSPVTVKTSKATYEADHLVITAGPWASQVLADLALPLRVTRQVLCWFEPTNGLDPYREEHLPVYLFEAQADQRLLYGFPVAGADAEGVKVALHGSDDLCTPDSVNREILAADETAIRRRLSETLPELAAGRLLRAETCLYTMTPDEHFLLGAHPCHSAVTIAAGFSGHGFKFAPVIGETLADLVLNSGAGHRIELFSLDRFHAAESSRAKAGLL
jgi:sarcosine oxidase